MVKYLLFISLTSILALEALFPEVNFADLSHVPVLIAHYQKHCKESPEITFIGFLRLHYADPDHLATTSSDHQDLPFSKRQHRPMNIQIAQTPVLIKIETPEFVLLKIVSEFDLVIHTTGIASPIWQPPRA